MVLLELGSAIRSHRETQGLSRAELARRASVSSPYISRIEAGSATPSLPVISRIAEALSINLQQLVQDASLNEQLAQRLPLVLDIKERSIKRLLCLPDEEVKRGLLNLVDRLLQTPSD